MPATLLALPALVTRLADLAAPWQSLYAGSTLVSTTVNAAHVGALLVGGGLAIGADRQTLRAARGSAGDRVRQLAELAGVHRTVLVALGIVALSGLALFLADVEEFAGSAVFWLKMGLLLLLVLNGFLMTRAESGLRRDGGEAVDVAPPWARLRRHAMASAALWIVITLAGVVLREG